jgi:hypothetical protein
MLHLGESVDLHSSQYAVNPQNRTTGKSPGAIMLFADAVTNKRVRRLVWVTRE